MANKKKTTKEFKRIPLKVKPLDRRTFIRGVYNGTTLSLALPILDIMLSSNGDAFAAGESLPIRFGTFFWGTGVYGFPTNKDWVPEKTGSNWQLPYSLTPFGETLQPYLTLISGFDHDDRERFPGHISAKGIALSASHSLKWVDKDRQPGYRDIGYQEPSIDNIVADAYKGQCLVDQVCYNISARGYADKKFHSSWRANGFYNSCLNSPAELYSKLFGNSMTENNSSSSSDNSEIKFQLSLIDALKSDANSFVKRAGLGVNDKIRLEAHLEGLREIERQLENTEKHSGVLRECSVPSPPGSSLNFQDGGVNEKKEEKSKIMSDIIAVGLACDITRVFSCEFTSNQTKTVFWEVGSNVDFHDGVSHGGDKKAIPEITKFIMKNFAYLANKLKSLPEGDGNVLDNTLIVGTSEHASQFKHDFIDHPYIFVGKAGGNLKGNYHHRHPNPGDPKLPDKVNQNTDAPQILLTAVRAAGVKREKLGQNAGGKFPDRSTTKIIKEVLAKDV